MTEFDKYDSITIQADIVISNLSQGDMINDEWENYMVQTDDVLLIGEDEQKKKERQRHRKKIDNSLEKFEEWRPYKRRHYDASEAP